MTPSASAIVMAGNGTNCEIETATACRLAGFDKVDIVTVWELLNGDVTLDSYDFLNLPGGFLDGDDLGSGMAQANRILNSVDKKSATPLIDQFSRFIHSGKLILGICNGYQLMMKLGLLPALDDEYLQQQATLTWNDCGKFEDRWVILKVNTQSPCIFTRGITDLPLPVRHGEGKFVACDSETLTRIKQRNQAVVYYVASQNGEPTMEYPANPNGSQSGIAGICDASGRVFGLMPHPEAFLHRTNHPSWTRLSLPEEGAGLQLFRNAYEFITSSQARAAA
ncbi:MAG: phosphoribosylformylglycinamidine synthase subunit PurQ [Chitinivibrionales bacterium]|nr:phosphoribosylformylglycinamidine synthase subunit PurQ [Chitinivibrionales bacterium]